MDPSADFEPEPPAEVIHTYPEVLQADEVMVDDTWVYWSNGDALWRAKKDGSSELREKMGPNGMESLGMELGQDEQRVYWVYEQHLVAVSKSTLEVSNLEFGDLDPRGGGLLVDRGFAYVSSTNCLEMVSIPLDGGEAQRWTIRDGEYEGLSAPLAADEAYVYCGTGGRASIMRIERDTGAATELIPPATDRLRGGGGIAVDSTSVYWIEESEYAGGGPPVLYRADKDTGENVEILKDNLMGWRTERLVLRDSVLYWTSASLQRFQLDTSRYLNLMLQAGNHADLAVDAEYLYWVSPGRVYRANIAALEAAATDGGTP